MVLFFRQKRLTLQVKVNTDFRNPYFLLTPVYDQTPPPFDPRPTGRLGRDVEEMTPEKRKGGTVS